MDRTTATHAAHDELLLARLYGGDVDEPERDRALDQVASCRECAGLFADIGAIAAATAELPTPPRPRDFTLTETEVARIGRRRIGWSIVGRFGRRQAFGGSMMVAGLAGVVLVSAISAFAPGAGGGGVTLTSNGAPVAAASAPGYEYGAPSPVLDQNGTGRKSSDGGTGTDASGSTAAPQASPALAALSASPASSPASSVHAPAPTSSAAMMGPADVPTAGPIGSGEVAYVPQSGGQSATPPGPPNGPTAAPSTGSGVAAVTASGPDARDVALATFAGLMALGVLLLVMPRLVARRRSRPR